MADPVGEDAGAPGQRTYWLLRFFSQVLWSRAFPVLPDGPVLFRVTSAIRPRPRRTGFM